MEGWMGRPFFIGPFWPRPGVQQTRVLNMVQLYMQGLCKIPNIPDYGSIRLNSAWIYLNVAQYAWTWLNIAECCWQCLTNVLTKIKSNFLFTWYFEAVVGAVFKHISDTWTINTQMLIWCQRFSIYCDIVVTALLL